MSSWEGAKGAINFTCECGKRLQRPLAQLQKAGKCSKCKAEVPPPASAINVDQKTFEKLLKMSKVPLFVDFWASWCAPCKKMAPDVERLAAATSGRALVLKVNTEENPVLSARYNIQSIPNFMIFKGGEPIDQKAGAMDGGWMMDWFNRKALA